MRWELATPTQCRPESLQLQNAHRMDAAAVRLAPIPENAYLFEVADDRNQLSARRRKMITPCGRRAGISRSVLAYERKLP